MIEGKKFSNLFAVPFTWNENKLINGVIGFEVSVIVEENILKRHCDGLCYIFIKLYWDRENFFGLAPNFAHLHFDIFSSQSLSDYCFEDIIHKNEFCINET